LDREEKLSHHFHPEIYDALAYKTKMYSRAARYIELAPGPSGRAAIIHFNNDRSPAMRKPETGSERK
jgi:hypothetical protein